MADTLADFLIITGLEARIVELEKYGTWLAVHLASLSAVQHANRYGPRGPCAGCFDAVEEWKRLVPADAGEVEEAYDTAEILAAQREKDRKR